MKGQVEFILTVANLKKNTCLFTPALSNCLGGIYCVSKNMQQTDFWTLTGSSAQAGGSVNYEDDRIWLVHIGHAATSLEYLWVLEIIIGRIHKASNCKLVKG